MFNIFIALFGGLYYGGKYISEASETKKVLRETRCQFSDMEKFKSLYGASFEANYQLKEYIMCGKNFEEICNILSRELEDVLGSNWKQELDIPKGFRINNDVFLPCQHIYWVYHLLLSKKGKMDIQNMSSGYSISTIDTRERNIKFLQHIENNLRENNVPVILVYEDNGYMSSVKPDVMCIHGFRRLW